jgi:hypothetical protein
MSGLSVYWYYPIHAGFIVFSFLIYRTINLKILTVLLVTSLYAFLTATQGENLVLKQTINILFSSLVFYGLIAHENFDIEEITRKYIVFCKIILVLGFVQVFLYAVGYEELFLKTFPFQRDTNITIRFQSITAEPSFIAFTFAPIVFISFHRLFYGSTDIISKKWAIGFIIGYWLTLSLTAYMGVLAMLIILGLKNFSSRRLIIAAVTVGFGVALFSMMAYQNVSLVRERVDDTFYGVANSFTDSTTYKKVNLSTYAFLSNAYVAGKSLEEKPMTGFGLGTHELSYDKFLPARMQKYSSLNREDANSLAIRLISETGLIGFLAFTYFIFRFRIISKTDFSARAEFFWSLNAGILVMILIALLRNGNYTVHGKILFLLLYYYSYQWMKEWRSESVNKQLREDNYSSNLVI